MNGDSKVFPITAAALGGVALVFICLVAYLVTLPFSFFADQSDLWELRLEYQQNTGFAGGGAALAAIAEQEYAQYGGTACGSRYWRSGPEAWCCDFVYWCADQLGYVGSDQIFGPWTAYVPTAITTLKNAGAEVIYPTDGTVPQPGDLIFFSDYYGRPGRTGDETYTEAADHIGIVVAGDESAVTVVEGNTGGGGAAYSKLSKNTYSLTGRSWGSTYILCFIRPNYPSTGRGEFLIQLSDPDPNYVGHPISLTASQRLNVCRALIGEQGTDNTFEIYVAEAQYICDYIEYGDVPSRSYDSIGHSWLLSASNTTRGARAATYSQAQIDQTMPELVRAVEYVFDYGGRAFQHIMGGYWDDDDEALGYSFAHNVSLTCGGGHSHEQIRLVNPRYANEWVVFYTCANKHVA